MERQQNSDIEVEVKFTGVTEELLPDFQFDFYTELHSENTYTCRKEGTELTHCVIEEPEIKPPGWGTSVRCILENHNLKQGQLCVLVHIKWPNPDYKDGIRDDIYRKKLNLIITP